MLMIPNSHAELEAAFSERTKAILVNSPHNPTGKVFSREDLQYIAELCQKWNVYAILDEVRCIAAREFVFAPQCAPLITACVCLTAICRLEGYAMGLPLKVYLVPSNAQQSYV